LLAVYPLTAQRAVQQAAQKPAEAAAELAAIPMPEPSDIALPLAEDRGHAGLEQDISGSRPRPA
jgi:hypothetical protein